MNGIKLSLDRQKILLKSGIPSGDFYKPYNNEQFKTAQISNQGVDIGSCIISALGQADDALLSSNMIDTLKNFPDLTSAYCLKFNVTLCPEKLLAIGSKKNNFIIDYIKATSGLNLNGTKIDFVDKAEHVGVIRSVDGNLPHILNRKTSHKKALGAVLVAVMLLLD